MATSIHQAMAVTALRNDVVLSHITGNQNTYHLGGAPGSGKTACVTSLVASLVECGIISSTNVVMCSKSNAATQNLRMHVQMPPEQFCTVNRAFSIPVIDVMTDPNDIRPTTLRRRIEECLGRLELLVLDEYMTTGALETVFIDAILRIVNHCPQVPFGGVVVIFLGDNRQNSSIPTDNDRRYPVTDSHARHVANVLTQMIENVFDSDWWTKGGAKGLANAVLRELIERKAKITSRVASSINSYALPPSPQSPQSPQSLETEGEKMWSSDFKEWPPELRQSILASVEATEREERSAKMSVSDFVERLTQVTGGSRDIRNASLDVLVEESLRLRISRLRNIMNFKNKNLTNVLDFVRDAFDEIVGTGREKSYVISQIGEYDTNQTPTATVINEILALKMAVRECDADQCLVQLASKPLPKHQDQKYEWLGECIRNAFFRTGNEVEGFEPLASVLFSNLPDLMRKLSDPTLTAEDMFTMAQKLSQIVPASVKDDDSDYDYFDMDDGEFPSCRIDTPPEIKPNDSIFTRAKMCVKNQIVWRNWLRANDDNGNQKQRWRFWHLYLLAKLAQVGLLGRQQQQQQQGLSLFGYAGDGIKLNKPYWLRALSMPEESTTLHLPAYSSMLSLTSRTFFLASLKRISVDSHAYGLMYALSLHNLTTPPSIETDYRSLESFIPDSHESSIDSNLVHMNEYLNTLFPNMMDEYFAITQGEITLRERIFTKNNSENDIWDEVMREIGKTDQRQILTAKALVTHIEQTKLEFELANKTAAAKGSLVLMKSNASKDAVARIVETVSVKCASRKRTISDLTTINSRIPSVCVTTKLTVGSVDVTEYLNKRSVVTEHVKNKIIAQVDKRRSKGQYLIDKRTDSRLVATRHSRQAFTSELIKIRDSVTKVTSIVLTQHQAIAFTTTNSKPYIFGTTAPFYATEKGVVTKIMYVKNELVVTVTKETGERINLHPGRIKLGPKMNGVVLAGAEVVHLPLASQHTLTIYSSQGSTFARNTLVDPINASYEDMYVAVTRNNDVRLLRILNFTPSDLRLVRQLRNNMKMGKDRAFIFPLGGGVAGWGGDTFSKPNCSLVSLVQRHILDRTGNVLAFNETWVKVAHDNIKKRSLMTELKTLTNVDDAIGHSKLLDLFMAVHRSMLHYQATASSSSTNVVSPSLTRRQLETLFYDIFPHSLSALAFGVYAHFLFVVYELIHLHGASFAFLPAAASTVNGHLRQDTTIPNGLEWESKGFVESGDCGRRACRIQMTPIDELVDKILSGGEKSVNLNNCFLYNRRRIGKYCRPNEVCGLNRHGAVVVAFDPDAIDESSSSRPHTNLCAMIAWNLRMAAASTVVVEPVVGGPLPPGVTMLDGVLVCGCDSMKRKQVVFWVDQTIPFGRLFKEMEQRLGGPFQSARVVVAHGGSWPRTCAQMRTAIANEKFENVLVWNMEGGGKTDDDLEIDAARFVFLSFSTC